MKVNRLITNGLLGVLLTLVTATSQAQTATQLATATSATFKVGLGPEGVATDGASVFVANQFSDTVTKLSASDGAVIGSYTVGHRPVALAFDGAS
ncbi:MAG TPA: hypothetical protein VFQ06_05240, partial [Nitrospira sp.]|nr:hypothetical protein [Nitrospira sp.]